MFDVLVGAVFDGCLNVFFVFFIMVGRFSARSRQVCDANVHYGFFSRPGLGWNHEVLNLDAPSLPYHASTSSLCTDGPKWSRNPRTHLRPPGCQHVFMAFYENAPSVSLFYIRGAFDFSRGHVLLWCACFFVRQAPQKTITHVQTFR